MAEKAFLATIGLEFTPLEFETLSQFKFYKF